MDRADLSVVVPCFNEEHNVRELVRRVCETFREGGLSGELVLVDDGSTDATRAVIAEVEAALPGVVRGVVHSENRGIARAWRSGLDASCGRYVAIIDADLQYRPEDLLRLYGALLDHSVDVVQGWRSQVGRTRGKRYWLSRGLNRLLNASFGMRLKDNKSGFVCCPREVMDDLLGYRGRYAYWQSFIMVAAHSKGYSYREVQTLFEDRRQGESFLDRSAYRVAAKALLDVARALIEYRLRTPARVTRERHAPARPPQGEVRPPSPRRSPLRWRAYMATFGQTHWMITREVERHYEALQRTQWLSPPAVRDLQEEKLRRLVRHAYRNVPFWRKRLQAAGLRPDGIRGLADLHKLPLTTKADVRKHLHFDLVAENLDYGDMLRITTSGSTGEPLVCYADRQQLEFRWAATLRAQEWTGYRFGDPTVRLWHQTIGMSRGHVLRERLDAAFCNRRFVPVFDIADHKMEAMIRLISSKRPVLLDGYAEALDFLARYIEVHGALEHRPEAVMSSAQNLPAHSREVIEKAFGCRVFDKYGAREFSGIAYECEAHRGHHVVAEGYVVEILVDGRPAAPGEIGEVVITDLHNFCMPFIRYRLGDLAVAVDPDEACPCGRGAPRIGEIHGRVQSIVRGTDGRYVPGSFFLHLLKDFEHAIHRFQVVQERPGAIRFRVLPAGRWSAGVRAQIEGEFRRFLGGELEIETEIVDGIELTRTGKRMTSISTLPVDFQQDAPRRAVT